MTDAHAARFPPEQAAARPWAIAGLALLGYALAGNYVALPGYRRFLERGGASAAGNTLDLAVVWGAAKTILWMFAFQLGAFCLTYAALRSRGGRAKRFRRRFLCGAAAWLAFWALPHLPAPSPLYFASIGSIILALIGAVFWRSHAASTRAAAPADDAAGHFRLLSHLFFALATWEVCGLGSVGRMLYPSDALRLGTSPLLATQTTKLILEVGLAWSFAWLATRSAHVPHAAGPGVHGADDGADAATP
jgi:hypothetical protein